MPNGELEYIEQAVVPFLVETVTDWNMFFVALIVGLISTTITIILYKKGRDDERKQNSLAVVKPSLKYACFWDISEKLVLDGNEERMLLLALKEDGFEFYDDDERWWETHGFLSICNEGENRISHINIETNTKLITAADAEKTSNSKSIVKLLRKGERILTRIYNAEQQKICSECIDKKETVKTEFCCTINYLTAAEQQIRYVYKVVITNIPKIYMDEKTKEEKVKYSRKTEVINDEYEPIRKKTINKSEPASPFRDLQDYLTSDAFGYRYRKIGDKQMTGTLDALRRFFKEQGLDTFVTNTANSVNEMTKSMDDVANAVDEQRKFFEEFFARFGNQENPNLIEDKTTAEVIEVNETKI